MEGFGANLPLLVLPYVLDWIVGKEAATELVGSAAQPKATICSHGSILLKAYTTYYTIYIYIYNHLYIRYTIIIQYHKLYQRQLFDAN